MGQQEAGQVLGMTKSQIFFKVTLLQMVKRIVPPMSNEIITLVKDTSLARIIAVTELIKAGESYMKSAGIISASYKHLRAHETKANLVCRLLLEKKKYTTCQDTKIYQAVPLAS